MYTFEEIIMFIVERIGKLILITLEGEMEEEEVEIIKVQIEKMAQREVEAVVSINQATLKSRDEGDHNIQDAVTDIVDFCQDKSIRVYSYFNK